MATTARPYRDERDFNSLCTLLAAARPAIASTHFLHIGDLVWHLFHMLQSFPPADLIRLWDDEWHQLVGFVLLYPTYGGFDLQVHPSYRASDLEEEMLEWAIAQLSTLPGRDGQHLPVMTLVHEADARRIEMVERRGFARGDGFLNLQRRLTDPLPPVQLPEGFVVRSLTGTDEAEAKATVLAAAFGAVAQPERYCRFMQAPGYAADLDLVAVTPDGHFGAFAMGWVDAVNRVGTFEPVGTAPEWRRHGLGRAVLVEGFHRLRAQGADRVIVVVDAAEHGARHLYEATGFEQVWTLHLYSRDV